MAQVEKDESQRAFDLLSELRQKGSLPAFADNVRSLCQVDEETYSNINELASIIMRDTGLTANIVSSINSALYGLKFPVNTVSSAVNLLGFKKIRALALGLSMFQQSVGSIKKQDHKLFAMYANSYFSGTFSLGLAREAGAKMPEELFVAGLLRQLPKLALANCWWRLFEET